MEAPCGNRRQRGGLAEHGAAALRGSGHKFPHYSTKLHTWKALAAKDDAEETLKGAKEALQEARAGMLTVRAVEFATPVCRSIVLLAYTKIRRLPCSPCGFGLVSYFEPSCGGVKHTVVQSLTVSP